MGIVQDAKEFSVRQSPLDLAVLLTCVAAVGKIISVFVQRVFLSPMSFFQITFELANQRLKLFSLGQGPFGEFSIAYSELLQVILNSLILAAVMFAVFRFVRSLIKRKSEKSEPTIETPSNVVVLQDWRDAIRKNGKVAEIIA